MRVGTLIPIREDPYNQIRHAAKLGFRSGQISIWNMSYYCDEVANTILKACSDFDFTVTAVWCGWSGPVIWSYPDMYTTLGLIPAGWRSQRTQDLLQGAAFARKLGVKNIVTHVGYMPDNPFNEDRIATVHAVRYICNEIDKYGQRFLFETGEELPLTLVQLIKEIGVKNIGVNFDPANLLINARANPRDALRLLSPYLHGFHAKDGVYPEGTNPKGKEVQIGEGMANFPALIWYLTEIGYDGDLTIEREIDQSGSRDAQITASKAFLEGLIAEAANNVKE